MRAIVTGQVGMEKKPYLNAVVEFAGAQGESLALANVGDIMYDEAPDVRPGQILNLPLSRLHSLRRAALKDVIADYAAAENLIVNTHATFRWRHGLFSAFDYDQIQKLKPDLFICLVDNIEVVHHRLHAEHEIDATLKDCMVWREEEILATELLGKSIPQSKFYIVSRGRHEPTIRTMFRLICRPDMKKVYPSFPMTHVVGRPDLVQRIDRFRQRLSERFITFDPGDVDEKLLLDEAIAAAQRGDEFVSAPQASNRPSSMDSPRVPVRQVLDIAGDIDGQIYMRDFKLIDQSDMIVSYIPELPDGMPGLSSGVERELQHAYEHTKDVYVVWKPNRSPSPFVTETATRIFRSTSEAMDYFAQNNLFGQANLFGH